MQARPEIDDAEPADEVDKGPRDVRRRLCVATREPRAPEDMIRFAAGPGGEIVPDLACRLPGRGVWVTARRSEVERAVRTGAFARSLKRAVKASEDLADVVEGLMRKRLVAALALANKAGQVVTGFAKVEAAVSGGKVAALLHAREAAADGAGKLDRRLQAVAAAAGREAIVVRDLEIEELSLALGRSNVVHAALIIGGASNSFLNEAGRYGRYRLDGRPDEAGDGVRDRQSCASRARTEQV